MSESKKGQHIFGIFLVFASLSAMFIYNYINKPVAASQTELACASFTAQNYVIDVSEHKDHDCLLVRTFQKPNIENLWALSATTDIRLLRSADSHKTLLHYAVQRTYFDSIKFLLANGVPINARDIAGKTALFYSLKYTGIVPYIEMSLELFKHGAVVDDSDVVEAINNGDFDKFKLLVVHSSKPFDYYLQANRYQISFFESVLSSLDMKRDIYDFGNRDIYDFESPSIWEIATISKEQFKTELKKFLGKN